MKQKKSFNHGAQGEHGENLVPLPFIQAFGFFPLAPVCPVVQALLIS